MILSYLIQTKYEYTYFLGREGNYEIQKSNKH